jgi:hypothetical protein
MAMQAVQLAARFKFHRGQLHQSKAPRLFVLLLPVEYSGLNTTRCSLIAKSIYYHNEDRFASYMGFIPNSFRPGSAGVSPNAAYFLRPQGAFGVRQLAAAFENGPTGLFFKCPLESGSELPHSKGFASKKLFGISRDGGAAAFRQFRMRVMGETGTSPDVPHAVVW